MEIVTVSQLSQIAISPFGECSDTPLIFCVSNDNDAFEAVTPVTACDRRSPRIKRDCHSVTTVTASLMRFFAYPLRLACHSVTGVTGQEIGFQLLEARRQSPHDNDLYIASKQLTKRLLRRQNLRHYISDVCRISTAYAEYRLGNRSMDCQRVRTPDSLLWGLVFGTPFVRCSLCARMSETIPVIWFSV